MTSEKSSKLIFCGVYFLSVLVYTKTTIHLHFLEELLTIVAVFFAVFLFVSCPVFSSFADADPETEDRRP